jgi:hypothetical protein
MSPIFIAFGLVFACFILILVKNLLWPADDRNRDRPHKTRGCGCSKQPNTREETPQTDAAAEPAEPPSRTEPSTAAPAPDKPVAAAAPGDATAHEETRHQPELFLIKPHVQLGTTFGAVPGTLEIVWHAQDKPETVWTASVRSIDPSRSNEQPACPQIVTVSFPEFHPVPAHNQHRALVAGRGDGEPFAYELYRDGELVFTGATTAAKGKGKGFRYVAVGDLGDGRPGQGKVANQISLVKPDLIVVPGDMAYKRGRFSENLEKLFPVMNHDVASPETGAPLLRSFLTVFVPGNHDLGRPDLVEVPDFDTHKDLLAYFYLWSAPLNGPAVGASKQANMQLLKGQSASQEAFLQAAAGRYPRMASFSFDYGNAHWLCLDSNLYMDWSDEQLRAWVRNDLASTQQRWKFVSFHHPSFTSHRRHRVEQRMRLIADILQETGVDVVWLGHAHWYERLHPLKFTLKLQPDGRPQSDTGAVDGDIAIDQVFDGASNTRPDGVLYVVTGGGGAKLQAIDLPPEGRFAFTDKLLHDRHFFTLVDVEDNSLTARVISEDGEELDRFTITK